MCEGKSKWAQGESEVPWRCPLLFFLWMWTNGDLSSQSRLLPVTSEAGAGKQRCLRYIVSQLCVTFSPLLFFFLFFPPSSTLRWLNLLSSSYSSSVCVSPCNSPGFWLKVTPSLLHLARSHFKKGRLLGRRGGLVWSSHLILSIFKKKKNHIRRVGLVIVLWFFLRFITGRWGLTAMNWDYSKSELITITINRDWLR